MAAAPTAITVDAQTIAEQTPFYSPDCSRTAPAAVVHTCRSYALLQADQRDSYPDLRFFLYHPSNFTFPSYLPTCSSEGIDSPTQLFGRLNSQKTDDISDLLNAVTVAAQDLQNLVYRMRGCDYAVSVHAWNTRLRPHDATFDFIWQSGCNSFTYEESADWISNRNSTYQALIAQLVTEIVSSSSAADQKTLVLDAQKNFRSFLTEDYLKYSDLFERLSSCSASVANLSYPPNTKRVLCNYAGFAGALLAGSAAAFGRRWTSGLQNTVTAAGTVIITYPTLCQNAGSGSSPISTKSSSSSGSSSSSSGSSK